MGNRRQSSAHSCVLSIRAAVGWRSRGLGLTALGSLFAVAGCGQGASAAPDGDTSPKSEHVRTEYMERRPLEDGEPFDFEAAPRPRDMYNLLHADNSMVCPTFLEALNDNSDRVAATPGDAGSRAANMFGTRYSVKWPFVMGETGKNDYVD